MPAHTSRVDWKGFQAFAWNLPLAKPGVYRITNLLNGKVYIGISVNVRKRLRVHLNGTRTGPKLKAAFNKYGFDKFLIEPLYYVIDGKTDQLPSIEMDLIAAYDSGRRGYNIMLANGKVGPYGEEFAQIITTALARPEVREKLKRYQNRPDVKARHSAVMAAFLNTPEQKAFRRDLAIRENAKPERRAAINKTLKSPEYRAKASAIHKIVQNDPALLARRHPIVLAAARTPARREKIAASRRGRMWITDGTLNLIVPLGVIPNGWRRGKTHGPESLIANRNPKRRAKISASRSAHIWITDGKVNRHLLRGENIPNGWQQGMTLAPKPLPLFDHTLKQSSPIPFASVGPL